MHSEKRVQRELNPLWDLYYLRYKMHRLLESEFQILLNAEHLARHDWRHFCSCFALKQSQPHHEVLTLLMHVLQPCSVRRSRPARMHLRLLQPH